MTRSRSGAGEIEEFVEDISILSSSNNQRHASVANKFEKERGKKRVSKIEHQRLDRMRYLDRSESEVRKSFQKLQGQKLHTRSRLGKISSSLDELDDKSTLNDMYLKVGDDQDRRGSCPDLRLRSESPRLTSFSSGRSTVSRPRSTEGRLKPITPTSSTENLLQRRQLKTLDSFQSITTEYRRKDSKGRELLSSHFVGHGPGHFRSKSTPSIVIQNESLSNPTKCTDNGKMRFRTLVNMQMNTEENRTLKRANMVLGCFGKSITRSSGHVNAIDKDPPMILPPVYQQSTRKLVKRDFKKAPEITVTDADWENVRGCRYVRCESF